MIPNIAAHRLGTTYTVKLVTEKQKNTVKVSAMSYVKSILDNSEDEDMINAVMALYNYYSKAMEYIA